MTADLAQLGIWCGLNGFLLVAAYLTYHDRPRRER